MQTRGIDELREQLIQLLQDKPTYEEREKLFSWISKVFAVALLILLTVPFIGGDSLNLTNLMVASLVSGALTLTAQYFSVLYERKAQFTQTEIEQTENTIKDTIASIRTNKSLAELESQRSSEAQRWIVDTGITEDERMRYYDTHLQQVNAEWTPIFKYHNDRELHPTEFKQTLEEKLTHENLKTIFTLPPAQNVEFKVQQPQENLLDQLKNSFKKLTDKGIEFKVNSTQETVTISHNGEKLIISIENLPEYAESLNKKVEKSKSSNRYRTFALPPTPTERQPAITYSPIREEDPTGLDNPQGSDVDLEYRRMRG